MLDREIPFEIHITTGNLALNRQEEFVNFCLARAAKPLMIELSKGDFTHQPMLSKVVYSTHFDDVLSKATEITNALNDQIFQVKRLKVEIPADNHELLKKDVTTFNRYFEWHGKINYTQPEKLAELCEYHKVHLSLNSLKNEANIRFITLREFGVKEVFEQRIGQLINELQQGNWKILKQQSEYCIYDNNCFLDNGWLPQ